MPYPFFTPSSPYIRALLDTYTAARPAHVFNGYTFSLGHGVAVCIPEGLCSEPCDWRKALSESDRLFIRYLMALARNGAGADGVRCELTLEPHSYATLRGIAARTAYKQIRHTLEWLKAVTITAGSMPFCAMSGWSKLNKRTILISLSPDFTERLIRSKYTVAYDPASFGLNLRDYRGARGLYTLIAEEWQIMTARKRRDPGMPAFTVERLFKAMGFQFPERHSLRGKVLEPLLNHLAYLETLGLIEAEKEDCEALGAVKGYLSGNEILRATVRARPLGDVRRYALKLIRGKEGGQNA